MACALVAALLISIGLGADYVVPEVENVPIDRLIANFENHAGKPQNAATLLNLARVHGMAYARGAKEAPVLKRHPEMGVWFGLEPRNVPFAPVEKGADVKSAAAQEHLAKAIDAYDAALRLDPNNLVAQIGRAWCVEQTGRKADAIAAYRAVIDAAWKVEKDLRSAPLGFRPVVAEAARYLMPLLDPSQDREEIAAINDKVQKVTSLPRPITPIAIPLRDGVSVYDVTDARASVRFDADGSGISRPWSWITPDAGWLVYDQIGTRRVTSALQLFGNVTFWMFWESGYDALAALDDDESGWLSGEELRYLAIWRDANRNGTSEPGEVQPLAAHGIVALSVRTETDAAHPDEIRWAPAGVTLVDGRVRPTWDLVLHPRPTPMRVTFGR
jgi:hypothetical protein